VQGEATYAFSVDAHRGEVARRFVVTAGNLGAAAVRAVEACGQRADGPWTVRGIQEIDEVLT
jgi:hypothetical protein